MAINIATTEARIAEEQEKGYRGARVDPHPNSAYSMESDPMTSPSAPRHGTNFVIIDEFADPASPYFGDVHGRMGLDDSDVAAAGLQTLTKAAPAQAVAGTAGAAVLMGDAEHDGTVLTAKITPTATIVGDAVNNRTFKVWNKTANHALFTVTTTATKNAGVESDMVADGADQTVSLGDDLEIRQTVAGTGVAHTGVSIKITVRETGTA